MPRTAGQGVDWKSILLGSGFLVTSIGWVVQVYLTQKAQESAYRIEQVSEFKNTGAEMDEKIVRLFNALAANAETKKLKEDFEAAYIHHVVKAEAEREILGVDSTERYLDSLNLLNDEVEKAGGPEGAGRRVEALADVIRVRRELSEQAL